MMQEYQLTLAHYLTWGCDNSPPLNRISSRDSEVCGRKVGYSARRRSSLSHMASLSEWCDHCTFRNLILMKRVESELDEEFKQHTLKLLQQVTDVNSTTKNNIKIFKGKI